MGLHPHAILASDTHINDDFAVPKIVLRDEKTEGDARRLTVYDHEGGVRLDGWDYGDLVEKYQGGREYEWLVTVAARDVPALVAALGGTSGEDVFEVIRRTCTTDPNHLFSVIVDRNIPHEWWHRVGD